MNRHGVFLIPALGCLLVMPHCVAAQYPNEIQIRPGWYLVDGRWLRPSGECDWDELVRVEFRDGQFRASIALSDRTRALLRGGRRAAVEVGTARDLYEISCGDFRGRLAGGALAGERTIPSGEFLVIRRLNATQPQSREQDCVITSIHLRSERGQDSKQTTLRGIRLEGSLRVSTDPPDRSRAILFAIDPSAANGSRVVLSVEGAPEEAPLRVSGDTFAELWRSHARELRTFLSPLLRRAGAGIDPLLPGAAEVYRAFAEIAPSDDAVATLAELLPRLHDPHPDVRRGAVAALEATGPAGVCAALRLSRSALSAQQALSIQQFLARHSRDPSGEAIGPSAAQDAMFLIDCLEFDADARVRVAAWKGLQRQMNDYPRFDPDGAPAVRREIARSLRGQVLSARAGR
jgi:hypothetical protein